MSIQGMNSAPAMYKISILQGPDKGKNIFLDVNREYLIGREEACDIKIDRSDKTVSRRHALLKVTPKTVSIQNLSKTNPILVKGKPSQGTVLKNNDQFQVGSSLFVFAKTGLPSGPSEGKSNKRILFLGVLLLLSMAFLAYAVFFNTGGSDNTVEKSSKSEKTGMVTKSPVSPQKPAGNFINKTGIKVSAQNMKKADEHYRQGMFFYDTGKIAKALDEWSQAIAIHPDHPDAKTWFLKAESELVEQTKTHYQNAMLHYKYMRYEQAEHEFRIVIEISRNKNSDIYMESLRYLDELRKR